MANYQLSERKRRVESGATAHFSCYMKDPDTGDPIVSADILTLTLSLWYGNERGGITINGRDQQTILNANNGVLALTSGLVDWYAQEEDTEIQNPDPGVPTEEHFFHIKWSWTSPTGTQRGGYREKFIVYREPVLRAH